MKRIIVERKIPVRSHTRTQYEIVEIPDECVVYDLPVPDELDARKPIGPFDFKRALDYFI